jgi:hypothetical protein
MVAMVNEMQPAASPAQPTSWAPTAKISAGALAAAATTLILFFMKEAGWQDLSAELGAAMTSLLTFAIQYFVPDRN